MSKGRDLEKRTHHWLVNNGYMVHTVQAQSRSFRYDEKLGKSVPIFRKGQNNDLFNMFDHVAVKLSMGKPIDKFQYILDLIGANCNDVIFVQTKSRRQYGKQLEMYDKFPHPYSFVFSWIKQSNGRYGQPYIQVIGPLRNKFKIFNLNEDIDKWEK